MNIFTLNYTTKAIAQDHADKLIVKMPVETVQMLTAALGQSKAYANHPCTRWAAASDANFVWLHELGLELCAEYTKRYGRKHKSEIALIEMLDYVEGLDCGLPDTFPICMPDNVLEDLGYDAEETKANGLNLDKTVEVYRHYIACAKTHYWAYAYTAPPAWWPFKDETFGRAYCRLTDKYALNPHMIKKDRPNAHKLYAVPEKAKREPQQFAKAKRQTSRAVPSHQLDEVDLIRQQIRELLTSKVPSRATVAKWLAGSTPIEERVKEHTDYWLARGFGHK